MEGKKCENGMKGKLWTTKIKQLRRLDRSDKQIDNHRTMMKWLIHDKIKERREMDEWAWVAFTLGKKWLKMSVL